MEDEERAEQLVAQTEEVYKRQHVYRTEIFQLQDLFIGEQESIESVHEAPLRIRRWPSCRARRHASA